MTPEIQSKIAIYRQKAVDGTLTLDEMKEAVLMMRQNRRTAAASASSPRRAKAKAEIKSADEMLNELGDI